MHTHRACKLAYLYILSKTLTHLCTYEHKDPNTYPNLQYRNKETWQKILSANFLGDTLYIYGIIHETIFT